MTAPMDESYRGPRPYWGPKLERNRKRDAANIARLREMGWDVLVVLPVREQMEIIVCSSPITDRC